MVIRCMLVLILLLPVLVSGQKHDYYWLMGQDSYMNPNDPGNHGGLIIVDFNVDPPDFIWDTVTADKIPGYLMYHGYNAAPISDAEGNLQFYTSGANVRNHKHEHMDGHPLAYLIGADCGPQQMTVVPDPGEDGRYIVIHDSCDWYVVPGDVGVAAYKFYYSIVDMNANNGEGRIILKRKEFIPGDTTQIGRLTAVRHGNGRDWWVLKRGFRSTKIQRYLISPNKYEYIGSQDILPYKVGMSGQAIFSLSGDKYIYYGSAGSIDIPIVICDFDRCTGLLSNKKEKQILYGTTRGSAAFSPSGRFMYLTAGDTIFQYDMSLPDYLDNAVIVGIHTQVGGTFGTTQCYQSVMGPDGRIYYSTTGGTKYMNVIDYPDEKGVACGVRWRQYMGAFMSSTTPNYPNYRLGPLDGSPCDTLGLNNVPLAEFRVRSDSTLTVRFIDRSAYEPETWYWTFGDGGTSTAIHPIHSYASAGTYEVCLTVSNTYGSDTYCRTITLGTVATDDIRAQAQVMVFPNPATEYLNINIAGIHPVGARLELANMHGQICTSSPLTSGLQTVQLPPLPAGMYVWRVVLGGIVLDYGKVVLE